MKRIRVIMRYNGKSAIPEGMAFYQVKDFKILLI